MKKLIFSLVVMSFLLAGLLPAPALAQTPAQCQENYTVQRGDWLSKIAEKYYGDVLAYDLIVQANNLSSDDPYTDIANPDLIEPGWTLCIPAVSEQAAATPYLVGTVWQWQQTLMNNDDKFVPDNPGNYTLQFMADGTIAVQADCNQVSGTYTFEGSQITIELGPSTMAACPEGSLGDQFVANLSGANNFFFDGDDLLIDLMFDSGTMRFNPASTETTSELVGPVWLWQQTLMNNDDKFVPDTPGNYTLQFMADGTVAVQADCNRLNGAYTLDGNQITIELGPSTMAACPEGSLGDQFVVNLSGANSFFFDGNDLLIELMFDSGTMRFSPQSNDLADTNWVVIDYNNGRGGVVSTIIGTELTATLWLGRHFEWLIGL